MREEEMTFCGTGSFKDVDKEKIKTKKIKSPDAGKKKTKKKENPYASRGLDKFSTVLAELESRREKVLRRVDASSDRVMVRFVQSGPKGWVPIVVKLPPDQEQQPAAKVDPNKKCCKSPSTESASASPRGVAAVAAPKADPAKKAAGAVERWRPSQYWPLVAVLLLAGLVVFGRVFAICCTSVWWYLVPILSGEKGDQGQRRSMGTKNKIGRKVGEKLTWASLPPPSHGKRGSSSGAHEVVSPTSHPKGKKG
ncbi:uncharacterized protein LOC104583924 isoform X1 [Brachypodium distachyon]|nr:uncharacterized protein LOC104583924 isoform X1 [Brachypodium distachyon]|eukprot:XP_010236251.1 uncharacterized protein LOC104583924 isoform X1 [Brachypodium distachyon]